MIVLYSSFFFERSTRKLCYPIKQTDGSVATVKVSMLDDFAPSTGERIDEETGKRIPAPPVFLSSKTRQVAGPGFREDFELYKVGLCLLSFIMQEQGFV